MIESKVIEIRLDANTTDPADIAIRETRPDGTVVQWEWARVQIEGYAEAPVDMEYAVLFGLRPGDCREFPDLPAEVLTASHRVTPAIDVRSVAHMRIESQTQESDNTPVTIIVHLARTM